MNEFDECMDILVDAVYVVVRGDGHLGSHIEILYERATLSDAYDNFQKAALAQSKKWSVPSFLGGKRSETRIWISHYKTPFEEVHVIRDLDGNTRIHDFPALSGVMYNTNYTISASWDKTYDKVNKYCNEFIKEYLNTNDYDGK